MGTLFFFATLKIENFATCAGEGIDESGNWSPMSNSVSLDQVSPMKINLKWSAPGDVGRGNVESQKSLVVKTPALTDFRGQTTFICYRRISVIANIENKENNFKGLTNSFCNRRISIICGSVKAGFNCTIQNVRFSLPSS